MGRHTPAHTDLSSVWFGRQVVRSPDIDIDSEAAMEQAYSKIEVIIMNTQDIQGDVGVKKVHGRG